MEGKTLRALSVHQPWASLLVHGLKRIETRSWPTRHRGPLAIHASKAAPPAYRQLCRQEPFDRLLRRMQATYAALPRSCIVGVVELVDCVRIDDDLVASLTDAEYALGDFSPGRWAWIVEQPVRLEQPIALRGQQGLYSVPAFGQWA